jgi:hypothetical protein
VGDKAYKPLTQTSPAKYPVGATILEFRNFLLTNLGFDPHYYPNTQSVAVVIDYSQRYATRDIPLALADLNVEINSVYLEDIYQNGNIQSLLDTTVLIAPTQDILYNAIFLPKRSTLIAIDQYNGEKSETPYGWFFGLMAHINYKRLPVHKGGDTGVEIDMNELRKLVKQALLFNRITHEQPTLMPEL